MCMSEPVSFVAGSALLVGGAYAAWKAYKINMRYFPVALMPVLAGIQQLMEGHVWMGLNDGDPWIPFAVYFLEPPASKRKKTLLMFAFAGLALGLILYIPHLANPDWVKVAINNHSISYEDTMFLDYFIPRELTYALYLFLIVVPPLLSTYLHMRLFGMTLITVVALVWIFLSYAYISFFCLLAGVATLHLIYIIAFNKCCRECPEIFR